MIELTTSIMLLLSIFYGPATANANAVDSPPFETRSSIEDSNIVDGVALKAHTGTGGIVEMNVREYFKDTPILAEVAKCESRFRHIGDNGEGIRGLPNNAGIGVMQINEYYHRKVAERLGIDLKTLSGNMTFAKRLYDKYGTSPWQSSAECWEKYVQIAKN